MNRLYVLYSNKDFVIRYVGITTKGTKQRLYYHLKEAKYCRTHKEKWINSIISNNYSIFIKTVATYESLKELQKAEIELIQFLLKRSYRLTNGTLGGDGVFSPTPEVRLKMSEARKKYVWTDISREKASKAKIGNCNLKGHIWSEESKLKASLAKKGKPSNSRKAVLQYDLKGNFIRKWGSLTDAAMFYNITITSIVNNLKNRSKTCNKFIWKYEK